MGLLCLSQLIFHDKALQPSLQSLSSPLIPLERLSIHLSLWLEIFLDVSTN